LQRTDYEVRYVEISERGKLALAQRGISAVAIEQGSKEPKR